MDEFGEPVDGALVVPQFADDYTCFHSWTICMPPEVSGAIGVCRGDPAIGIGDRRSGRRLHWRAPDSWLGTPSGVDGAFELRGLPAGSILRLKTYAQGLVVYETPPLAPGARDVRIVLRHAGTLAGSIDCEGVIPGSHLRLDLVYPEDTEPEGTETPLHKTTCVGEDGRFDFGEVPAGVADLHVRVLLDPDPLQVIRDIHIPIQESVKDSRVEHIDLTGLVRVLHLRVLDDAGHPVQDGRVHFLTGAAGNHPRFKTIENGRVDLPVRPGRHGLAVTKSGYLCKRVEGVADDQEISLTPGIPVVLSLPKGLPLPNPPLSLHASLIHSSYSDWTKNSNPFEGVVGGFISTEEAEVLESGEFSLIASDYGDYKIRLWIHHRSGIDHVPLQKGEELAIDDGVSRVRHHLAPDLVRYAEALQKFGD